MPGRRLVAPFIRQLAGDPLGLGRSAQSARSERLQPRTRTADRVVQSICPYCAVGCGQKVYVKDDKVIQIEGDPDSPVNEGTLCPKGATAMELAISKRRLVAPLYRAPGAGEFKRVSWDFVLDKLARHIKDARDRTFVTKDEDGAVVNRCEGIAFAGGAAFSNEEGYLATKLMRGLGLVFLEQQARV